MVQSIPMQSGGSGVRIPQLPHKASFMIKILIEAFLFYTYLN